MSTSTQLSGFVNTRGVFGLKEAADTSKALKIMSMNKWNVSHKGQHVELGMICCQFTIACAVCCLALTDYALFVCRNCRE